MSEHARLAALAAYEIFDTPPERDFDEVAWLASEICGTPIAVVNLIGEGRQFFKAEVGLGVRSTPLETSFCAKAILEEDFLVVPDATKDPRFDCNPLVTGEPGLRFYAGALLKTEEGQAIGTVCVLDFQPRTITPTQERTLRVLARQVMKQLDLRRAARAQTEAMLLLRENQKRLGAADERLQMALNASGVVGLWDWMVDTDLLHGDANFARLYGLDVVKTEAGLTMEEYQEFVVPEDLEPLRSRIRDTFERGANFLVEYRLAIPGQELRWVECKGRLITRHDGQPQRFSGTAVDVSERKRDEEKTRRLAAIVEQSADFIGVASLDGAVTMVNAAGRRLVGLTDPASVHGTTIRNYFDPDQWPEIAASVFPALEAEGHWRGELRFRHFVTGASIPVIYDVIALRDGAGSVTAYATVTRDITEQKKAEATQHLLNQELSHRLKNTLAMVQAIAGQTLRGVTEKEAVAAFTKRIHAIAAAHDVLLQQSWSSARIGAVVDGVLGIFDLGDRFKASGPDVSLGPRATLSLSMLLHELATNALKYGALSADAGRVTVKWRLLGSHGDAEFALDWSESGGPPPRQPDRKGFGSRLIDMGLVGTGGSELRFLAHGFEAKFKAPLSQVQES